MHAIFRFIALAIDIEKFYVDHDPIRFLDAVDNFFSGFFPDYFLSIDVVPKMSRGITTGLNTRVNTGSQRCPGAPDIVTKMAIKWSVTSMFE
jgi:hypothetical protein